VNDLGGSVVGSGTSSSPADDVVKEIRDAGGTAIASHDSVAEYDSAGKIVQAALDKFGRLDILVHVAGILRDRMIFNMTEEEWDGVLQVHLYGAFNMVRHSVPHLIEQKYGRIVLFASVSGLGASGQANYASAKEGIVGFSRALSRELAEHSITINAIYPAAASRMTATIPESTHQLRQQQRATAGQETTPNVQQSGSILGPDEARAPENNAPKVVHLCTEEASEITGQVFGTGGWPMTLYSPRHITKSIHKSSRWTLDDMDELIPISLGAGLINPMPPQEPKKKS